MGEALVALGPVGAPGKFLRFVGRLRGGLDPAQGGFYSRLSANTFSSDGQYDDRGDAVPMTDGGTFRDRNIAWYQEHGVSERVSFLSSVAFKQVAFETAAAEVRTQGVGDVDLGLRVRLRDGPLIVSLQPLVKLPYAYDGRRELPLGNGQIDGELRLLLGRSFPKIRSYGGLEIGYRYRADAPVDQIRYLVEFGGTFSDRIAARVKLDGTEAAGSGSPGSDNLNPTMTDRFDLGRLETTVSFRVARHAALEATWTAALYGRNTARGDMYSLAVAWHLP